MICLIRHAFEQQGEETINKEDNIIMYQARSYNFPVKKETTCESHSRRVHCLHLITVWNILEPFLFTDFKVLNVILLVIITVIFRLRIITIVILGFSGEFCSRNFLQRQRRVQVNIITNIIMVHVIHYLLDVLWNDSLLQLTFGKILLPGPITLQDIEFQQMNAGLIGI